MNELYILYLVHGVHATTVNLTFLLYYLFFMTDINVFVLALAWYVLFMS